MLRKGQSFYIDFIVSVFIFLLVLGLLIYASPSKNGFSRHHEVALTNSQKIMSEGIPSNWTEDNYVVEGILDEGKVSEQKLDQLQNLSLGYVVNIPSINYTTGEMPEEPLIIERYAAHKGNIVEILVIT